MLTNPTYVTEEVEAWMTLSKHPQLGLWESL